MRPEEGLPLKGEIASARDDDLITLSRVCPISYPQVATKVHALRKVVALFHQSFRSRWIDARTIHRRQESFPAAITAPNEFASDRPSLAIPAEYNVDTDHRWLVGKQ